MATDLKKIIAWLTPLIALAVAFLEKGAAVALLDFLEQQVKVFLENPTQSLYPVGGTAFLSGILALTGAIRYRLSTRGYYYAPKGKTELALAEIRRLNVLLTLMAERDQLFDTALDASLHALGSETHKIPIWIRHSGTVLRESPAGFNEEHHELHMTGRKALVEEFCSEMTRQLHFMEEQSRLVIVRAEPALGTWSSSIRSIRDVRGLPLDLKLEEEKRLDWLLRIVLGVALAALFIAVVRRLLRRGISQQKAVETASKYVETLHNGQNELKALRVDDTTYTISFGSHTVRVDRKTGRITGVEEN